MVPLTKHPANADGQGLLKLTWVWMAEANLLLRIGILSQYIIAYRSTGDSSWDTVKSKSHGNHGIR